MTPLHSVSVAGITFDEAGRVLLIVRRDSGQWQPPGGVLELDETPEQGVVREVLEETGVEVEPIGLSGIYKNMTNHVVALVYRCRLVSGEPTSTEEAQEVAWREFPECLDDMTPAFAIRVRDALSGSGTYAPSRVHDGVSLISGPVFLDNLSQASSIRVSIDVDLINRAFVVTSGSEESSFGIPEGVEIVQTDLMSILASALAMSGASPTGWWEFIHDRSAERDEFTTTRFRLVYHGAVHFGPSYLEWTVDSNKRENCIGYRGDVDGEDEHITGCIHDIEMRGLSYDLATSEKFAMEKGYALEGNWKIRALQDLDSQVLIQARMTTSWNRPRSWSPRPF